MRLVGGVVRWVADLVPRAAIGAPACRSGARGRDAGIRCAAVALAVIGWSSATLAAPVPSLDLRGFRAPLDSKSGIGTETPMGEGEGEFHLSQWFGYAHHLVALEDRSGERLARPVAHQWSFDTQAVIGLTRRLTIGADIPFAFQSGDSTEPWLRGGEDLSSPALGDLRLVVKPTLLLPEDTGGLGVGGWLAVTLPTGTARGYLSDRAVTVESRALGEIDLLLLKVRAAAGFSGRTRTREFARERFEHQAPWAFGLAVRPQLFGLDRGARWIVHLETRGALALTPRFGSGSTSPASAGVSVRVEWGDFTPLVGAELPLNSAVLAPALRAVLALTWTPRTYDADADGIDDDVDQCPRIPEDFDGFQDGDGCPEADREREPLKSSSGEADSR